MLSNHQQINVPNTLDVEAIERMLAELWQQSAGHDQAGDDAVFRARVAGLMVFLHNESLLSDTQQVIGELSSSHPCRALLMAGDRTAAARDIEMYVSAFCGLQPRSGSRNLCCEEITLTAQGHFVSELPSAAVPLLVPDLPVFLWWRAQVGAEDRLFKQLCLAADRVVIDSADFQDPGSDLVAVAQLFNRRDDETMVLSDLNWARLTGWRASLANFYDVPDYREHLDQITDVGISVVAETAGDSAISSQALLMVGWLASRLQWKFAGAIETQTPGLGFNFEKNDRPIRITLNEVQRPAMKSGRLCEIELRSSAAPATFVVSRSEDGLHLKKQTTIGERSYPGRWLLVENRSAAQLLSREMEILSHDKIYEEAIAVAPEMMGHDAQDRRLN